jgi:hypothetical protein
MPAGISHETRQVLEMEHLVGVIAQMVDAPQRSHPQAPQAPAAPEPNRAPRPTIAPQLVRMGFPDNAGPPVIHGPGMANRDALGQTHTYSPLMAEQHMIGLAAVNAEAQDEISRVAQAMDAAQSEAAEKQGFGFSDNPGPPVVMRPGTTHHTALGEQVSVAPHEDPVEAMEVHATRSAAIQDALSAEAKARDADLEDAGNPAGFPDNPGPRALHTDTNVHPVDLDAVADAQAERAEQTGLFQDEVSAQARERDGALYEQPVLDDPDDLRDLPSLGGDPLAAGASADDPDVSMVNDRGRGLHTMTANVGAHTDAVAREAEADAQRAKDAHKQAQRKTIQISPSLNKLSITDAQKRALTVAGYGTPGKIRHASDDDLLAVPGVGPATLEVLRNETGERPEPAPEPTPTPEPDQPSQTT